MKKQLALLLACILLLSNLAGCSVSAAEGKSADFTVEPFYGVGGTEVYASDLFSNVRNYSRVNIGVKNGVVYVSRPGCGTDLDKIVADLKADMDSRPKGMRYLQIFGTRNAFGANPQSVIYLDDGVDQLRDVIWNLMQKFHEIGGTLTGVALDLEYIGLSSYYLSQDMVTDPLLMQKIVEDPHYATEVRPLLEERGFEFWPNPNEYAPEIYSAHQKSGSDHEKDRAIWDRVMTIRLGEYQMESCCEPVWKYYPDALINDYQSVDMYSWSKMLSSAGGNRIVVGNVSNYSSYHSRPSKNMYDTDSRTYSNPTAYNEVIYKDTPFNMLKYDNNLFKTMYLDSHTNKISVCICAFDYSESRTGGIANTAYYPENIFHLGLLDECYLSCGQNHRRILGRRAERLSILIRQTNVSSFSYYPPKLLVFIL